MSRCGCGWWNLDDVSAARAVWPDCLVAIGGQIEVESGHDPTAETVLVEDVLAPGLDNHSLVAEVLQAAATGIHNVQFVLLLWYHQIWTVLQGLHSWHI